MLRQTKTGAGNRLRGRLAQRDHERGPHHLQFRFEPRPASANLLSFRRSVNAALATPATAGRRFPQAFER
jgi:hypothetical protein